MKKLFLAAALFVVALFGISSAASATIVSHGPGDPITANGTISLAGAILTTNCDVSLNGTVTNPGPPSPATISVTSGNGNCNTGSLSLDFDPAWIKTSNLDGSWSLATVVATVTVPGVGDCSYSGHLGGSWTSDGFDTILTISNAASSMTKTSGSILCTSRPTLGGTVTLLGVVTE